MATRISDGTPISPVGTEYVPLGTGSGKAIATTLDISNLGAGGAASGDLSGTYPNPSVIKINGFTPTSNIITFLAAPTSANLIAAVSDETGTGSLVFATSPTLVTPILGIPQSGDFSTGTFTWPTFNQSTTGSAASLTTGRTISITGDITYTSPAFNGTGNVTSAATLATVNSNVGTFASVTVNGKGLVTAAANLSGDITSSSAVTTLATVNSNVGTFGSATKSVTATVNGKGLITAISEQTVTPAVGSVTGFGTGVATALAVNTGSAGAFVVNGGALGTPSSGTLTNATGLPAASVVAGALANGMTTTTQSANDNSTKIATTAYADGAAAATGTSTPTASTVSKWDANKNMSAAGFIPAYTTTATAAGTTILTVGSNQNQYFTGTTTQTVTLPVTSTLVLGQQFIVTNLSTGVVTVNSSGANVVQSMAANSYAVFTCILTSGTTATSWNVLYSAANPMTAVGDVLVGGTVNNGIATPSKVSPSTAGYVFGDNGAGVAPSFQVATSDMIKGTTTNSSATAGYIGETITGTPVTSYTNFTTSATYKNISSIALTAGNWVIRSTFTLYGNSATITTTADGIFVVSTTTASATGAVEGKSIYYIPQNLFVTSSTAHATGTITFEVKLNGSQTYYLNGQGTYSVGNMQYVGSLEATRIR